MSYIDTDFEAPAAASHTPGPWHVHATLTGALSINLTPKVPIASVGGMGWHLGEETAKANARLIAAAPDLLEAAKLGLMALDDTAPDYAAIKAAIAKAEGRE